jgi:hypothetical protein
MKLGSKMKIKLLFILLLINYTVNGQDTNSLIDTNKLWSTLTRYGQYSTSETYFTKFIGDTAINSLHYYKVFRTFDEGMISWINDGYIREDSSQKVFYKKNISENEVLFYDFNAHVDDTVFRYINQFVTVPLKVDSIDSINIAGSIKKRMFLWATNSAHVDEIWIEGIGSLLGIFFSGYYGVFDSQSHSLLCFYEKDTLKYINTFYNDCYIVVGVNEISGNTAFSVFPNPNNGTFVITSNAKQYQIEIFNLLGEKVYSETSLKTKTEIDISSQTVGIYFLKIVDQYGNSAVRKIVRE